MLQIQAKLIDSLSQDMYVIPSDKQRHEVSNFRIIKFQSKRAIQ